MRLLVLQFRQDVTEEHEQQCIRKHLSADIESTFISIFDKSLPFDNPEKLLKGYDKIILGGSAGLSAAPGHDNNDYEKIDYIFKTIPPLIEYLFENDFPTLAVCFGLQIIGHFLGSQILYDKSQAESGFADIRLTEAAQQDPIFKDMPSVFTAVVGHQDSLNKLPENTTHLADSKKCAAQCFRYKNNIYATQFHSELNTEELLYRLSLFPEYIAHAKSLTPKNTDHAVKILTNFLAI